MPSAYKDIIQDGSAFRVVIVMCFRDTLDVRCILLKRQPVLDQDPLARGEC